MGLEQEIEERYTKVMTAIFEFAGGLYASEADLDLCQAIIDQAEDSADKEQQAKMLAWAKDGLKVMAEVMTEVTADEAKSWLQ